MEFCRIVVALTHSDMPRKEQERQLGDIDIRDCSFIIVGGRKGRNCLNFFQCRSELSTGYACKNQNRFEI